ncbi:DUF2330 domain-containing protein [Actinoallomurus sp. NPDC050550]|uniref:DUF2330 domain-containing protein n=1 Tax=Actinoallomurus sp. NPDC050550 TaxID=3154937 RepID=UPI0033C6C2DF
MRGRSLARLLIPLVVAAATLGVVRPSWACGCGALITSTDSGVNVAEETSIVRYDGSAEEIVMRLSVRSSARDAAWLMPTPARATVTLGERGWFEQLDRLTEPRVVKRRHWFPDLGPARTAGAPAPRAGAGVGVLRQQRLGPFEVTTLSARDSHALASWLTSHGYRLKGRLAQALEPYVARRWTYTAIRLAPESGPLTGELDPLRIRFTTAAPVYPIRLSRLASTPQAVHLYVLAPHRVTVRGLGLFTTYAGRVSPAQVSSPGLRGLLGGGAFLTEMVRQGIPPSDFTDDLTFANAGDTPYQQVDYVEDGLVTFLGVPAFLWLLGTPVVALVAVVVVVVVARRSRRARRGVVPEPS